MPSVPDQRLVFEILNQIDQAIVTIFERFEPIECVDNFLDTSRGQEKLDSICMLFIAIGESLKNLDKITENTLLNKYPQIDWKAVKGMRDILSHHYFDINAEAVFNVCQHDLKHLHETIKTIIKDIKE
jgi:uncharacterized protein with HEPN domain